MKKGALFTIDAMLAILLMIIFLIFIYSSSQRVQPVKRGLEVYARDSMKVLHESGYLEEGISDTTNISLFLDNMAPQICGRVEIYDEDYVLIKNVTKVNCGNSTFQNVNWRLVVSGNDYYPCKGVFW